MFKFSSINIPVDREHEKIYMSHDQANLHGICAIQGQSAHFKFALTSSHLGEKLLGLFRGGGRQAETQLTALPAIARLTYYKSIIHQSVIL